MTKNDNDNEVTCNLFIVEKLSWSAFQRELTILTTTIIILEVHNYKCYNSIPENILLSVTCII